MTKLSKGLQIAMAVLTVVGTSVALFKKYKEVRAELAPAPVGANPQSFTNA